MGDRGRRPRSALATVWILVICAAVGTGIGLVVREVRSADGGGPRPIRVRPAREGPQSPAGLWLFGATTVRLDPAALSDPRDVGFQAFGAVLGGESTVYLYDPVTGRVGVIDATRNELAGQTSVEVHGGVSADVAPVLADQRGALWLVTGPGRLTREEFATGATTEVTLPTDVVSEAAAGGPTATRHGPCTTSAWSATRGSRPRSASPTTAPSPRASRCPSASTAIDSSPGRSRWATARSGSSAAAAWSVSIQPRWRCVAASSSRARRRSSCTEW